MLAATIESGDFLTMVMNNFDALDIDSKNSLTPEELVSGGWRVRVGV